MIVTDKTDDHFGELDDAEFGRVADIDRPRNLRGRRHKPDNPVDQIVHTEGSGLQALAVNS